MRAGGSTGGTDGTKERLSASSKFRGTDVKSRGKLVLRLLIKKRSKGVHFWNSLETLLINYFIFYLFIVCIFCHCISYNAKVIFQTLTKKREKSNAAKF